MTSLIHEALIGVYIYKKRSKVLSSEYKLMNNFLKENYLKKSNGISKNSLALICQTT